jgi:hypothetical protein
MQPSCHLDGDNPTKRCLVRNWGIGRPATLSAARLRNAISVVIKGRRASRWKIHLISLSPLFQCCFGYAPRDPNWTAYGVLGTQWESSVQAASTMHAGEIYGRERGTMDTRHTSCPLELRMSAREECLPDEHADPRNI